MARTMRIATGTLLFLLAIMIGRVQALASLPASLPLREIPDQRSVQPVVELTGMNGAVLTGRVTGDVRVVTDAASAQVAPDGTFHLPLTVSSSREQVIALPAGMQFFASRTGKVYYSVRGRGGSTIKPQNRVYFRTAEEAQAAGYRLPKLPK